MILALQHVPRERMGSIEQVLSDEVLLLGVLEPSGAIEGDREHCFRPLGRADRGQTILEVCGTSGGR